ncbi:vacuolar protein sorting-associated protein 37B-like isoform X1 [Eriocheir sinensis]|uniref:vacuolar protein sorting-associated protein 37B-like isoform X1 n=2 Tax=Eriocheir sinensis TaxID=95602 RepID=UPI0021C91285|nr:vacuolar protein sorting-associated protein 37B-like isoform X1 [Eriocheir sinensis]
MQQPQSQGWPRHEWLQAGTASQQRMMSSEPDYGAALGLINHLPTEELRDLVNNDDKLTELVKDVPQMKNLANEQEILLAANKSLAEFNLSLEPKLSQAKQALISKYEEAAQLSEEVNTLKAEFDSSSGQYTADTLQALLQTAAQQIEEETENLVQSFLDKENEVDDFLSEFLSKRKTAHLRRIKAEKITSIVAQQNSSSHSTPYPPPPTAGGGMGYGGTQWASPYPTQPVNMPMPGFH